MNNDLLTYLDNYQNKTLEEVSFNEVDALLFASLSYPKYHEIIGDKDNCEADELLDLIRIYDQSDLTSRKKFNITLLEKVCSINRYKGIKLLHYRHSMRKDICEQFQAASFLLGDIVVVSFCGTDNTTVGIKEDLNMSYLQFTPSEIDAMNYLDNIRTLYPSKLLVLVGHSKGGRLAVSGAKNIINKSMIKDIYTFDAPNYTDDFYDEEYSVIENKIHSYVPDESIIGRLINEPKNPIIVKSYNSLIQQHDISSWMISDNHLIRSESGYSKQSNKITNALNSSFTSYDNKTKKEFLDILFGLVDRLDIQEFKGRNENIELFKSSLTHIPHEWKNTPKKDRALLKTILFKLIKDYVFGVNKKNKY